MNFDWNIFRILADLSHTMAKCILIWAIYNNKSAEGVSLMTQQLYLLVFLCRYLPFPLWQVSDVDYFDPRTFHNLWNFVLKVFYILSSAFTIFIMMRVFARTREKEKAWKIGISTLVGSLTLSPFVMLILTPKLYWGLREWLWTFSIVLESTCVLPQLLLLRQTTVPTVIDSFYLLTLGSYRAFYVANWIVRGARGQPNNPTSIIFGVVQTILYIDFAWVYFTRQRVKLRGGSVVDSEDLSKGWIVKRLLNRYGGGEDDDTDPESGPTPEYPHTGRNGAAPKPSKRSWGPRGISVSADATLDDHHDDGLDHPARFEDADDDEDDENSTSGPKPVRADGAVGNGEEWRDNAR